MLIRRLRVQQCFFVVGICLLVVGCQVFQESDNAGVSTSSSTTCKTASTLSVSDLSTNTACTSSSTTATCTAPSGTVWESVTIAMGTDFLATHIRSGKTIFGLAGTAPVFKSNASRDLTATQLTALQESTTYAGTTLPSGYRSIPNNLKDDDGGTFGVVTYATRPSTNCGTTQATVADRIADCATLNGSSASWNGSTLGNAGQSVWKLVTNYGSLAEVWQDQQTGLLWSSLVSTGLTWCRAVGSKQADASGFCNNSANQDQTNPRSACEESGTYPAVAGEAIGTTLGNAWSGTYLNQKGGMGALSSPRVYWRLPTIYDYQQANVNGIRFVLPEMGYHDTTHNGTYNNTNGDEWAATSASIGTDGTASGRAWMFSNQEGSMNTGNRNGSKRVRCVGR